MSKKLGTILCLITIIIVGTLAFLRNQTIDFPTIWFVTKLIVPAGIVAYIGGCFLAKILKTSKADTTILTSDTQKKYIDDLLMSPEEVFNLNTIRDSDYDITEEEKNNTDNSNEEKPKE